MNVINILSIAICLIINNPDTIFIVRSNIDTICIMSNDIDRVDTFGLFQLTYHLSKEMSDSLHSKNINSCQLLFKLRNKDWIMLQEYEMRAAKIPEGYYVTTDFGKIVYKKDCIHIGYNNYPDKLKKKNIHRKRNWTRPVFW